MARGFITAVTRRAIGALRWRVTLERAQGMDDGAGGFSRNFVPFDQAWASIQPLGAALVEEEGRVAQDATHRIAMRWRADLDTGCRIVQGARIFTINAVADADETRRYLIALVQESRP
ncbi:MAG: phage head closure protein [Beijerinckiaceae bacterium]